MLVVNLDLGRHCNTPCLDRGVLSMEDGHNLSLMSRVTSHFFGGFGNGRAKNFGGIR